MDDQSPQIKAIRDPDLGFIGQPWRCGPIFELVDDYFFQVAMPDGSLRGYWIPGGYRFDKASIPPIFWGWPLNYLPDGLCTVPSLEHDFLCDLLNGGKDWLRLNLLDQLPDPPPAWVVHQHFQARLFDFGVRPGKAIAMGRAVAAFGPQGWAWRWLKRAAVVGILWLLYLFIQSCQP